MTGKPPTNEPTDRDRAAKLANLLEDLQFPATTEDIKNHINKKSPSIEATETMTQLNRSGII